MSLSFTPESKLSHKLWYFSTTEGFKSGGANSFSTLANFKPEEIISVELGYKYSAKNITWQLAGFHYDYKDLQVLTYESGVTTITNAANATLKGIDANLLWEVDNNWSWQAGVTALKANYDTFITSQSGVAVDVSGKVMPYAPQWDFNQTIHYQHALPLGKLQLSLHHHYQSRTYFNQFSDKTISEPSRHIYNAQAMWKLNQHWNFSLSVMNLTDENYYEVLARFTSTSIASAPEGNALGVAAPGRQFLANIHYGF